MRIAVTGRHGQVARSLLEAGPASGVEIVALARPELDLLRPQTVLDALRPTRPDLVVSAAAYTEVDKAESEPDIALAVNGTGAGAVAAAARALGVPVIHISTDYVFDGRLDRPYVETDAVNPINVYGASKAAGEDLVRAVPDHAIVRTSWIYSAFGKNFVKTMVALGASRDRLRVVADQVGGPTSAHDLALALIKLAGRMTASADPALRGTFHLSGSGTASWADLAGEIFAEQSRKGRPDVTVEPIDTASYPTPAARPGNSRLDCTKIRTAHGIFLPDWRQSLRSCLNRLADEGK